MCIDAADLLVATPRPDPATERTEPLPIAPVDALQITSLVDNSTDLGARHAIPRVVTPPHQPSRGTV